MTSWKMPEWAGECIAVIGFPEEVEAQINNSNREYIFGFTWLQTLRTHNLLSTPSERDAQNKRIAELEAEVERLKELFKELSKNETDFPGEVGVMAITGEQLENINKEASDED